MHLQDVRAAAGAENHKSVYCDVCKWLVRFFRVVKKIISVLYHTQLICKRTTAKLTRTVTTYNVGKTFTTYCLFHNVYTQQTIHSCDTFAQLSTQAYFLHAAINLMRHAATQLGHYTFATTTTPKPPTRPILYRRNPCHCSGAYDCSGRNTLSHEPHVQSSAHF